MFECSPTAMETNCLREGFDFRYGARHLKRAVERLLVSPLSNLVASEQVQFRDLVHVDLNPETVRFTFAKQAVWCARGRSVKDLDNRIGE